MGEAIYQDAAELAEDVGAMQYTPHTARSLAELGFTSLGVLFSKLPGDPNDEAYGVRGRARWEAKRAAHGLRRQVFLSAERTVFIAPGVRNGEETVFFCSLLADGTLVTTKRKAMRPVILNIAGDDADDEALEGELWLNELMGDKDAALLPHLPRCGLISQVVLEQAVDRVLAEHLALVQQAVAMCRSEVVALEGMDQFVAFTRYSSEQNGSFSDRILALAPGYLAVLSAGVVMPPVVTLWWSGVSVAAVVGGVVWMMVAAVGSIAAFFAWPFRLGPFIARWSLRTRPVPWATTLAERAG